MSDFLTGLVARSRGQETGLVPRVPTLYEPTARAVFGAAGGDVVEVDAGTAAPPTSAAGQRGPSPVGPPVLSSIAPSRPGPTLGSSVSLVPGSRPDAEVPVRAPAALARPGRSSEGAPQEQRASSPALRPNHRSGELTGPPDVRALPPTPPRGRDVTLAPRPVADGAMSEHLSARRPAEPGGEQTPQPLRVEVVTTRRRHDEQAPAESVRASEPVVHVTIGRIEIRAVEERASRPTPSQRPPALSLDDYLAERNQGRPR